MPDPIRQQVRDAAKIAIAKSASFASDNVLTGKHDPVQLRSLPAACVYTSEGRNEPLTVGGARTLVRTEIMTVLIIARATKAAAVEDTMDVLFEEVEDELTKDSTLKTLLQELYLETFNYDVDAEGENIMISATLNFIIEYSKQEVLS